MRFTALFENIVLKMIYMNKKIFLKLILL
jgi:hypothetical protein